MCQTVTLEVLILEWNSYRMQLCHHSRGLKLRCEKLEREHILRLENRWGNSFFEQRPLFPQVEASSVKRSAALQCHVSIENPGKLTWCFMNAVHLHQPSDDICWPGYSWIRDTQFI